jgi:drug/metabolite transporter (DMT)-like permease
VAYVVPITAAVTGWVFLGAGVSAVSLVGFGVVVVGFALVERRTLRGEVCRLRRWRDRQRGVDPGRDGRQRWPCDD